MGTRLRITGLLGVLLIGAVSVVLDRAGAQGFPLRSVFQVLIMNKANGHAVASGTGFFVGADGTALTSSHVVSPVRTSRGAFEALAIVNQEFYGVEIICASALLYDPAKIDTHGASRDVAQIKLIQPRPSLDALTSANIPFARAHVGPFPKFPALPLGEDPAVGDTVRVLGFGNLASPLPYEWSAMGRVSDTVKAADGTPLFRVIFTRKTEPGHSGSPVLNTRDQVVGIHSWHLAHDPMMGVEISSSALRPACP
jgi:V8-like Glu-specific endopeptidase